MADSREAKMIVTIEDTIRSEVIAQGILGEDVVVLEGYYYFSPEKVNMKHLIVSDRVYVCPYKGNALWIDWQGVNGNILGVAWVYHEPPAGYERIAGRIAFYATGKRAIVTKVEEQKVETV